MPSDFSLPIVNITTSSFELEFEVMDTRLNISLDVFDDSLLESRTEAFFLTLSIPPNPANNLVIGSNSQTTVHILDNEGTCYSILLVTGRVLRGDLPMPY